jgi:hypothetical protein
MSKNMKGILVVAVIAGLGYLAYKQAKPGKRNQVHYLIAGNYTGATIADLLGMGDDYIAAWYKAAKDGKASFTLSSGTYNVKGGKAI